MSNPESGTLTPELIVNTRQLAVRRPMGIIAVHEAISTTFSLADAYVRKNQHLIGYNIGEIPSDLQIAHRDKDTGELTKFGIFGDTENVHSVDIVIHHGGLARNGDMKYDRYSLSRGTREDSGLKHLRNGGYETQLIELTEDEEYVFSKGIGPKRQERSGKVLQIMQDRILRLQEGE